ncbi:MAG: hypothetical protein P4L85_29180 [Paludisphaera borealis]|uniref:hypothetical protein n=1 Tax=Paludisphaera borealis TaxID=1387353 RepID=UPI00284AEEBA|nr:hypothetical protein [Paludisphaera borealis]MDR3623442.1 hypothetical protein [Paludisphaera borealis]
MDQDLIVSVVRSGSRRDAVAEALALIAAELRAQATPALVLLPQPGTHADTLSAMLDAMFHAGAVEAVIVESLATAQRAGHRREAFGRPVQFVDPGGVGETDLLAAIADASCEVALACLAKNGHLRRADEVLSALPRSRKRQRQRHGTTLRVDRLTPPFVRGGVIIDSPPYEGGAGAGSLPLAKHRPALTPPRSRDRDEDSLLPGVLVVDAFDAGRTVIAGTDAPAVAAVVAAVFGNDREMDLARIRLVGDPIAPARLARRRGLYRTPRMSAATSHNRVA